MTENGIERAEKAVEALVYGTVGLALYVRDTAPSFIKLFVARGKNELGQPSRTVADPLAQFRNLGDLAAQSAPQILRVVGDQVGRLRERAEDVIAGFGTPPSAGTEPPPYSPAPPPASSSSAAPSPSSAPSAAGAAGAAAAAASATGTGIAPTAGPAPTSWRPAAETGPATGDASGLAITDYDELSASQVVDRLEGLPRHELEAIRDYERAHRARNTILGKIEQLTR
ncbi:MAG TPA: hypothetical protein VFC99_03150 [Acidimicrobiia bacterium]|nr:hypothetical protein [Acidimicrobiia bacterium]